MRDYTKHKTIMRAAGIPLLVIGVILVIIGFSSFGSENFEETNSNLIMFAAGGFLLLIGFILVGLTIIRPMAKYYATEAHPGIETASHAIGSGLKESGFETSQTKEVIKIKCPHCGYLESEDAEFCSKCGKEI
jgi:hypothetical protein